MKNRFGLGLIGLVFLVACSSAVKFKNGTELETIGRIPASNQSDHPRGHTEAEAAEFEHLSEGSDIFPYEWMMALRSANYKNSDGSAAPFYQDLDRKFGILKSQHRGKYLMDYTGMSAAWSARPPESSDALESDKGIRVQITQGIKSIKMVGTNCTMCHNGELQYQGQSFRIAGAPNMANIRGYFEELAQSTIATLADEKALTRFMREFQVENPAARAKEVQNYFLTELGNETTGIKHRIGNLSALITLVEAKFGSTKRLYRGKEAIAKTLEKLLRITYGFGDDENIGELSERMKFLGTLMVGTDPDTAETMSGYGRTDAFGRIGNLVLRGTNPIGYTAPVSLPWIWGIKYMSMLHYTANTNSVTLRNIGQSLGLGAIITSPSGDSTVNLKNLDRLEHLVHRLKVPEWRLVFQEAAKDQSALRIDTNLAQKGQLIFKNRCQHCHEASERVGPQANLYDYHLIPLDKIGTDPQAAKNVIVPVDQKPFEQAIFAGVGKVKRRYYERFALTPAMQTAYEFKALRGNEFFRDTLLGFREQAAFKNSYGNIEPGFGYKARHLAGVWATGPFLHNGSIPTLYDLLKPAGDRPRIFNVQSREFDPGKVGYESVRARNRFGQPRKCRINEQQCFDTTLTGNSNAGHLYGTDLNEGDRFALLEYLKILPPESEYASEP